MSVINSNVAALRSANASTKANTMLSTSMERLSTGKRINSAKDDAAGLAISTSMNSQIRGMNQGIRNANDGISLAQTAEGALEEVSNMLLRMRELTVQSENGIYAAGDKANIDLEREALAQQIGSVVNNTTFNGKPLFVVKDTGGAVTMDPNVVSIQAGANAADKIDVDVGNLLDTADATSAGTALSKVVDLVTVAGKGSLPPVANAATLVQYDEALASIGSTRAKLGAAQNQMQSAVNNLTSNATNLSDAKSRIEDADFSAESTALAKASILSQASTAMLSQANQSQQSVLQLLK